MEVPSNTLQKSSRLYPAAAFVFTRNFPMHLEDFATSFGFWLENLHCLVRKFFNLGPLASRFVHGTLG